MLIFKGTQDLTTYTFRYNSKYVTVSVGDKVDVRDFDVANKDVNGCEKHIIAKHPGLFEITDEKKDGVVSKEALKELKDLKKLLEEKNKEVTELKEAFENVNEKHSASVGEIEAAKKETASIKKDLNKIKKENSDLVEEIEGLRLQIGTGKK